MVNLEKSIHISPDVMFQEVGGEAVLLDLRSEKYLGLNETGTRIWQLLQQSGDLHRVLERMLAEYDVDARQMERDLVELVGQLADAGLVTVEGGDHAEA
jgi:hypothetical protein